MNRLTFGIRLLICFFAFDAIEKAAQLGALYVASAKLGVAFDSNLFIDRYFPLLLTLSFDILLAIQLFLRTRAGRFWGMIYLAALTGLGIYIHVVEPRRWVELGQAGRIRDIVTYVVNLLFLGVLAGRRSARILAR